MYKAVIFDLDDTLYDYQAIHKIAMGRLCSFVCQKYGITAHMFDQAFDCAKVQIKALLKNTGASHNRMLYCQKTLEYL